MLMYHLHGDSVPGLGWRNWSADACPYTVLGTEGDPDAVCCYPGNDQPLCPNYNAPSSSSGSGPSPSPSDSSTWANVGAGAGSAVGAFLKQYLTPSQASPCGPGKMMGPQGVCIPVPTIPPPQPWYTTPFGMIGIAAAAVGAYMLLK